LIETVGRDFGDFARQTIRILYTTDELRTCVLPPDRPHLSRKALDIVRFRLLNGGFSLFSVQFIIFDCSLSEAVRVKYRLALHLYDDFFRYHLGPKLGDFLVEERRREHVRNIRKQAKLAQSTHSLIATQNTVDR
jgi:hypothetical protein